MGVVLGVRRRTAGPSVTGRHTRSRGDRCNVLHPSTRGQEGTGVMYFRVWEGVPVGLEAVRSRLKVRRRFVSRTPATQSATQLLRVCRSKDSHTIQDEYFPLRHPRFRTPVPTKGGSPSPRDTRSSSKRILEFQPDTYLKDPKGRDEAAETVRSTSRPRRVPRGRQRTPSPSRQGATDYDHRTVENKVHQKEKTKQTKKFVFHLYQGQ